MAKYLTKEEILSAVGVLDIPAGYSIMSQDSYNEQLICTKIVTLGNPKELVLAAINLSIVGFGNQKFGSYRMNEEIISIQALFNKLNVKYTNQKNSLLKEDELTPQRLLRFYRHHIQDYILRNKVQSYLFRKYSTRNPKFVHICFRGAEYLENLTKEEATYLLETVEYMDESLGTRIQDRVRRVFDARGQDYTDNTA